VSGPAAPEQDLIEWAKRPSRRNPLAGLPQRLQLHNRTWVRDAACRGGGPAVTNLFYAPLEGETKQQKQQRVQAAIAICRECRARIECLRWALQVGDAHGILGGTTPADRRRIQQVPQQLPR